MISGRIVVGQLRTLILCLLALVLTGCSSSSGPPPGPTPPACVPASPPEFAYLVSGGFLNGPPTVSMYTINSCSGTFTAAAPPSVPTGITQFGAEDMVVDPLRRFAYVANLESNAVSESTISMFTINPGTGVLTPTSPATVPTGFFPQAIAIDPSGKFVYTANTDDNTVSMFTINAATGILTPTTPATVATGTGPVGVTVHPSGKFAYAVAQDGTISMFTIDSGTGVLSPAATPTLKAGDPFALTIDPSGRFAYVADNLFSLVWQFTIDPGTGVLSHNTPANVPSGNAPTAVAVDPLTRFAYAVNRPDNTLSMYTIDPTTGNLTQHNTIPAGTQPFRVTFDPSGKYLYVVNEQSAVSIFTVNSDGSLTTVATTGLATGALQLAITPSK